MNRDQFINAMREGFESGSLGGGKGGKPSGSAIARFKALIPILARASILLGIAQFAYSAYENRYVLMAAALAILWVGRGHIRLFSFDGLLGSARFMTVKEMLKNGYLGGKGLILGRAREKRPNRLMAIYYLAIKPIAESEGAVRSFLETMSGGMLNLTRQRDEPLLRLPKYIHALLVGPAGSGKNVSYVIPIILSYEHSMVITDGKDGENFKITADARRAMSNVLRLDPFCVHGPGERFNIFDLFRGDDPMMMANARQLADSLAPKSGREKDDHWINWTQELLTALILFIVFEAPEQHRTLNLVRYFAADLGRLKACFAGMKETTCLGGILAEMGCKLDSIPDKEFGSVQSTTNQSLAFLADPLIAEHVGGPSSFDLRATTRNTTVYLVLPSKLMTIYSGVMRLWLNAFILVKKDEGLDESNELMLMLDEVGNLGQLACLKEAVTTGRGMGLRCFFVLQAQKQIEACFPPPDSETLLANFDLKIYMNPNDLGTAKVVSETVGKGTVTVVGHSTGNNQSGGGLNGVTNFGSNRGRSYSPQARDAITPDEVMRTPDTAYVFIAGKHPLVVTPLKYYQDRAFEHFNPRALQPTPSPYSWAIALFGLYFALPIAWDYTRERLPSLPRWDGILGPDLPDPPPAPIRPVVEAVVPRFVPDGAVRRPTPTLPRWPSAATCPRCKITLDTPEGYSGEVLACPDCPAQFIIPKR